MAMTCSAIALYHPFVRLVHLLDRDYLNIRDHSMLGAEIEHLLSFTDTTDERTGEVSALHDQRPDRNRNWTLNTYQHHDPGTLQQAKIGVVVVLG